MNSCKKLANVSPCKENLVEKTENASNSTAFKGSNDKCCVSKYDLGLVTVKEKFKKAKQLPENKIFLSRTKAISALFL